MKKQSFIVISLLSVLLLFSSCGEENTNVEVGKEFKIEESPITILKLEEAKVLRSSKDEKVQVAPKGKKYVYFEVKNIKKEMIFLKAFNKEVELKADENLYDYLHDLDTGYTDAYYLIDENATIDKIIITTPSETEYAVLKPSIIKSKLSISKEIEQVINSYTTEKAIGLVQGFAPFVKDGKNVFEITEADGLFNIMSNKAEVISFTEDGKKYVMRITDVLKGTSDVTSYWENGKVTRLEVVEN